MQVARRHLFAAGLQEVLLRHTGAFGLAQHAEDGADAHVYVDVARAVQGVEQQQEFALRVAVGHQVDALHLLAGHGGEVAAPLVGFDQHIVGDDVELFLDFTLHVFALGGAQHATERALVDGQADAFAGAGHHLQQQAQLGWDEPACALLLNEVAGE